MRNMKIDQSQQLNEILVHAYENTPFYRQQFKDAGLGISDLAQCTIADLPKLPFVNEQSLREQWNEMSVMDANSFRATTSGGTTGKPKLLVRSRNDWERSLDSHIKLLRICGLKESDRIMIALPFDIWSVGFLTVESCKFMGCFAVPVGVRMDDEPTLDYAERFNISAVITSPSRWVHLSGQRPVLHEKLSGLRMVLAGEPVADVDRKNLEYSWNGIVRSLYGSEETDGLGAECGMGKLGMHVLSDRFIFETIGDNLSTKSSINCGVGELVVTSLYHRGTPLIRYRLGDLVEIFQEECPCECEFPKIRVIGKCGEVLAFRDATRVFGYQIDEALTEAIGSQVMFQAAALDGERNTEVLEIRISGDVSDLIVEKILRSVSLITLELQESIQMGVLTVRVKAGNVHFESTKKGKQRRLLDLRKNPVPNV
ncbi:MAG: AMP-binding protein [Planctomycetota bacterium]